MVVAQPAWRGRRAAPRQAVGAGPPHSRRPRDADVSRNSGRGICGDRPRRPNSVLLVVGAFGGGLLLRGLLGGFLLGGLPDRFLRGSLRLLPGCLLRLGRLFFGFARPLPRRAVPPPGSARRPTRELPRRTRVPQPARPRRGRLGAGDVDGRGELRVLPAAPPLLRTPRASRRGSSAASPARPAGTRADPASSAKANRSAKSSKPRSGGSKSGSAARIRAATSFWGMPMARTSRCGPSSWARNSSGSAVAGLRLPGGATSSSSVSAAGFLVGLGFAAARSSVAAFILRACAPAASPPPATASRPIRAREPRAAALRRPALPRRLPRPRGDRRLGGCRRCGR